MTHGFSKRRDTPRSVPFDPCRHLERDVPFTVSTPHTERWWLDLSRWRPPASHEGEVRVVPPEADAVVASVALSTQWREVMLGFHRFG